MHYLTRFCCMCSPRTLKLMKFYENLGDKMSSDFNVIKIMKHLRASKVYMHNGFLDRRMKFKIDHSTPGVIEADVTSDAASDLSSEKDELA